MPRQDTWQVRSPRSRTYGVVIANGPPDTETLDRRRVDPPAGCRAAAEPATCLDGGPSTIRPKATTAITLGWWSFRFTPSVREAAAGQVVALVAQEPFDVGD